MADHLRILHFNDVYRVTPQKTCWGTISVTQFAQLLTDLSDDSKQAKPLILFSGDVFSPSVESTVTRGSHMVPVLNALGLDVALTGNHDFDFGYPQLTKLMKDCNFPWILSNIHDSDKNAVPDELKEYVIVERSGIRIGIIGLVEKEWIQTVPSWPSNFEHKDMVEVAINLSEKLRDPSGDNCDLIIGLTHSRLPNDILLAKTLHARPSSADGVAANHGVDIILGGHDHLYYASKGCARWEGFDLDGPPSLGSELDDGVLVVKSGTDFRDLSELKLELDKTSSAAVRKYVIKSLVGKRHTITSDLPSSENMEILLKNQLNSVSSRMQSPLCKTITPLDLRSDKIRTGESSATNWFADILHHCYDGALCMKGASGGADGVFICAGTLRGDSIYGPGVVTLGDLLEILPFEDPIVILEMTGKVIWQALESSLKTWPAQEGRFPVISGFRVKWDSRRPPGQRVVDVSIQRNGTEYLEKVEQNSNRTYKVVTREYMSLGHDGYDAFKGCRYLVDEENGTMMSTLIRKYLLGSQYISMMRDRPRTPKVPNIDTHLHHETLAILSRARIHWQKLQKSVLLKNGEAIKDAYNIDAREHMQCADYFDGDNVRSGGKGDTFSTREDYLIEVRPEVDGRLEDLGRP